LILEEFIQEEPTSCEHVVNSLIEVSAANCFVDVDYKLFSDPVVLWLFPVPVSDEAQHVPV